MPRSTGMKRLDNADFTEFQIRAEIIDKAYATYRMLNESFDAWAASLKKKYRVKGRIQIDRRTGEIAEEAGATHPDSPNGNTKASS